MGGARGGVGGAASYTRARRALPLCPRMPALQVVLPWLLLLNQVGPRCRGPAWAAGLAVGGPPDQGMGARSSEAGTGRVTLEENRGKREF